MPKTKAVLSKRNSKPFVGSKHLAAKIKEKPTAKLEEKQNYVCVMCNEQFKSRNMLVHHFRRHGNNEIDIRGRPMLESTLLKHPPKVSLMGGELIVCEWCPEAFQNISKAIEHKFRKHRYESTNYFCELCGKLFPLKIALDQHKRVEHKITGDEVSPQPAPSAEFKCKICGVQFQVANALKFHEKHVHAVERRLLMPTICPPPSKKIKMNNSDEILSMYYCHLCGSEYMLKFNLRKHLEDHHTAEERNTIPKDGIIMCKTCEAIFYSKRAYDTHNINHKPDDLYVTSEEQRQQVVARVDQDFDIRRVPTSIEKFIPVERSAPANRSVKRIPTATTVSTKASSSSASVSTSGEKSIKIGDEKTEESDESMSPASAVSDTSDEE